MLALLRLPIGGARTASRLGEASSRVSLLSRPPLATAEDKDSRITPARPARKGWVRVGEVHLYFLARQ